MHHNDTGNKVLMQDKWFIDKNEDIPSDLKHATYESLTKQPDVSIPSWRLYILFLSVFHDFLEKDRTQ